MRHCQCRVGVARVSRLLLLFEPFGGELVLQVLDIIIGIVLNHGLWRCILGRCRFTVCAFPSDRAEDCGEDDQQRGAQIEQNFQVLLQDTLRLPSVAAQLREILHFGVEAAAWCLDSA